MDMQGNLPQSHPEPPQNRPEAPQNRPEPPHNRPDPPQDLPARGSFSCICYICLHFPLDPPRTAPQPPRSAPGSARKGVTFLHLLHLPAFSLRSASAAQTGDLISLRICTPRTAPEPPRAASDPEQPRTAQRSLRGIIISDQRDC